MNRFAPRHAFVLGGLLLVSLAAWTDRHAIDFFAHVIAESGLWDEPDPLQLVVVQHDEAALRARLQLAPEVAASERLRAELQTLKDAGEAFSQALEQALIDDPDMQGEGPFAWDEALKALDERGWEPYESARARALPAYRAAVTAFAASARGAGAADPGNGAYELLAALAELDLCYEPSPADPIFNLDQDEDVTAARIRVIDDAGAQRRLEAIERALAAKRLTFHASAVQRARGEACDGVGPLGQLERLSAVTSAPMPELMFLWDRVGVGLTQLARRARLQGRPAERYLRAARLVALRQGAEGEAVITVLVGLTNAGLADQAWLVDAASRGDTARTVAANEEWLRLQRARAASLRQDLPRERLGLVDWALLPAGGWGEGWTPEVGLATDFAYMESGTLWLLTLLLLGVLARSGQLARRPAGGAPIAPWTFGDLLAVVVPSVGGAIALTLGYFRLHPATQIGTGMGSLESRLFPIGALVFGGVFGCTWLLRRSVLAKAGRTFARPRDARASLGLALAATGLALSWIGPWSTSLAPLTLALALASLILGWRGGVFGLGSLPGPTREALAHYQGRVGLACVGAGLLLVGLIQVGAVSWRRERLTRELVDQHVGLMLREARVWGGGRLQDACRELLEESPERPLSWLERQE